MTITAKTLAATLPISGSPVSLDPKSDGGIITLDSGWAPYAQGSLVIPIPADPATLEALNPLLFPVPVVTVTAGRSAFSARSWTGPETRTFELQVRGRVVDHNAETVTLTLASNEAGLQDAKLVATAPDTSLLPYQSSVRAVCSHVLARNGFALEAGTEDADFTTATAVTNLLQDPGCTTTTGRALVGGSAAVASTVGSPAPSIRVTSTVTTGTSVTYPSSGSYVSVTPGTEYYAQMLVDAQSAGWNAVAYIRWFDSNGTVIATTAAPTVALTQYTWTLLEVTGVCPAGAEQATVIVQVNGMPSGGAFYTDQWMFVAGNGTETDTVTRLAYFDGSTAATSYYAYAWTGTANASTSARTPLTDRTPDALTQQPGTSDWDLLSPVLSQVGLRLFCDEIGVWRLVDDTYSVSGRVVVASGFNAYTAQDTISRDATADDGSPLWFDACVIKYTWTDSTGTQQTAWDAYAVDGYSQVAYFEKSYAYPGPGMAQSYVKHATGHGRTLALAASVDYTATPGMEASSSLPGTDPQIGSVASVKWDFGADTMTVGTRGLTDASPYAWAMLAAGRTWASEPAGGTWANET